ncbi:uncharacterized protein LOC143549349 [Bidens hawaiensis]|uniref:uncharacterized protein LOC143549349 n=1 Tax=Bidens hawaiensis TaxID=980011 RepID=UPI004049E855
MEVTNHGIKRTLEKTVSHNRRDWSEKLDDTLWAFRTVYQTPKGTTSFKLVYVKACHLSAKIKQIAYWALKTANLDLQFADKNGFMQLHELDELRTQAYENSWISKERMKGLHDARLKGEKHFKEGDQVLLYNSRIFLFPGKLKSRWSGSFTVKEVFDYGVVELVQKDGHSFMVNGHRLKLYLGKPVKITIEVLHLRPIN